MQKRNPLRRCKSKPVIPRTRKKQPEEVDVTLVFRDWLDESHVTRRGFGTGVIVSGKIIIDAAFEETTHARIADANHRLYFEHHNLHPIPYTPGEVWRIETLTKINPEQQL